MKHICGSLLQIFSTQYSTVWNCKPAKRTCNPPPTRRKTAYVWYPCYYGCSHTEPIRQLFLCMFVCVCAHKQVSFQYSVFLLVVEVIWKECSGKGGASQQLNQQGRTSNESAALTWADANWKASQHGVTHTETFTSFPTIVKNTLYKMHARVLKGGGNKFLLECLPDIAPMLGGWLNHWLKSGKLYFLPSKTHYR